MPYLSDDIRGAITGVESTSRKKMHRLYKLAFDARPAQGKGSGVVTYSLNLIKHFSALSDRFKFVFIVDSSLDTSHIAFPNNSEFINSCIGRGGLRNWFLRDYFTQFFLPRRLAQMEVHLYHQPDYFIPVRPVPFVVVPTFLDAIAFTSHDDRSPLAKARIRKLLRKGAKNADAIVTISRFSKQELLKHLDLEPKKIKKIWCGVSDEFFKVSDPDALSSCKQKIGSNGKFILYYGGYAKRKNVELLLDAFKIVAEKMHIKLIMAGKMSKDIEKKVGSLDLGSKVKSFGFAQEAELKVLLEECELFVFPSSMEGFGLPVAEAMACGACIVCSTNGSLPEIAGSAALYFEGSEPQNLALAILKGLEDSYLRDKLRKEARLRAQQFRWEKAVEELKRLYLGLIKKKFV